MDPRDRDAPVTAEQVTWDPPTGGPGALFFPSGLAWYFDAAGDRRRDLTSYGWTGIHELVAAHGVEGVRIQYAIYGAPAVEDVRPVLEQVEPPTEFDSLGGMAGLREGEVEPSWPAAWLWVDGSAWYFDGDGDPLSDFEARGWAGLHDFLDRYDATECQYRLAATVEDTAVADPATAARVREMVVPPSDGAGE